MSPSADPYDFSAFDVQPAADGATGGSAAPESSGWGAPDTSASSLGAIAGPPIRWIVFAGTAAVIGIGIAAVIGTIVPLAWAAWILSGPVAIGLLAVFGTRDTKERAKSFYSSPSSTTWLYRAALVLALIGVVVSALRLAEWVGRL
jgi:hypothetical protein